MILNYTKKDYLAKITELETYHDLLDRHLDILRGLKSEMFNFWDDEEGRKTAEVLNLIIKHTATTMTDIQETLALYRSNVEKLGGASESGDNILDTVLELLKL